MSSALSRWNGLPSDQAEEEVLPCCGSRAWARGMTARRPIRDESSLFVTSDDIWRSLGEADWMEAFRSHPRIGESHPMSGSAQSTAWSGEEQGRVSGAADEVNAALAEGNRIYEQRFQRTFIVCATGKSPLEILEILRQRLGNDEIAEMQEAAEQQRQIARLRLKKWLYL